MTAFTINAQEPFEYKIKSTAYKDPANQKLSITTNIGTITGLKEWLRFNPLTWSLYGVPPADLTGNYKVTLTVSDPYKGTVTDSFDMKVNSKPTVHPTNGPITPTYQSG